jgi:hypothetical protein
MNDDYPLFRFFQKLGGDEHDGSPCEMKMKGE